MIANQFTETEMTSQFRAMKFIFSYAFSFSFFQISKRIRHQISVSPTSQTDHKNLFVFSSVMFSSFSTTASSTSIFQSQEGPQSRFKFRKSRSMTNAVQMDETEFPADVDSSNNKQNRIEKKVQISNIFAAKTLMTKLTQDCFCKNDVV